MATTNDAHQSRHATGKQPSRWRWLKIAAAAVAGLLIVVWFAFWLHHRLTHVSENDARVATHEISVSSRLAGRVTVFDRIRGDRLAAGDRVAQLYNKPARLKLAELKARGAAMRAALATQQTRIRLSSQQLSSGVEQARNTLAADKAAVAAATARMQSAHDQAQRAAHLYAVHGATEQKRNATRYTYRMRKAEYQRARHQQRIDQIALITARTGVLSNPQMNLPNPSVQKQQLKMMRSKLAEARAALEHQRTTLDDLRVASPIDGIVDQTFVEQDEYVSAGQPLLMMHDPDNVWIEAKIKETKIAALRPGQPVAIHVDARPDIGYRGHVAVIGHAATNEFALLPDPNPSGNFTKITQRIPVRIDIDHGPRAKLSPGMMVEVDIDITAPADTQRAAHAEYSGHATHAGSGDTPAYRARDALKIGEPPAQAHKPH